MNVVRGRVRDGHVELDSALPDGAEVAVVLAETVPFDLDGEDVAELKARIADADARQRNSSGAIHAGHR